MPRVLQTKVGSVFLKEVATRKWRASWTDPTTKKHIRRVLPAGSFRQALEQAQEINKHLAAGRGFGGRLRGSTGHTVADAVLEAVRHTDASLMTRRDYLSRYNRFAEYLAAHAPGVVAWADVTEQVATNYLEHCRREGVAYDMIRMRLFVLRLTSAFMTRTYRGQCRDVTQDLKIRRNGLSKAKQDMRESIVSPGQLRGLLYWLQKNDPMVHVWALLQGLAGLKLLEAAYLREQDIDFEEMTVTVAQTSAHTPKTRHSYRTIPVCSAVTTAVAKWVHGLRIRHNEGYIFTPSKASNGRARALYPAAKAGAFAQETATYKWRRARHRCRLDGVDLPPKFIPRRLRASFVTALRSAGADIAVLQAYLGQAPTSILSAHYDQIDDTRLGRIVDLAQDLFEGKGAFQEELDRGRKAQ